MKHRAAPSLLRAKHVPTTRNDPILALMTEYFSACQVLHGDLYEFKDAFLADTTQEDIGKFFWVYLNHWLSSLWIVAHAFQNVLELQDRIINRLIEEKFQNLSAYRNVTYHYHRLPNKRIQARALHG